ncbi:RHS repeat-associated core domain-containing protein [Pseudomonas sp. NPDC089752]|uniref:RHS repeat-associated core domain-containing protein n=1 Tax=Pseudomonas sp. NPDC089752 TaxID=3364472 RepID=UPI003801F52C
MLTNQISALTIPSDSAMSSSYAPALHADTPRLTVFCSRGFPVRELDCFRKDAADAAELRITRHQYTARGHLGQSRDPRLGELNAPNFHWHSDLAGNHLRTESVDAGIEVALADTAGRPLVAVSATGVGMAWCYQAPSLAGRLLAVMEKEAGEPTPRVAERYRWAGTGLVEQQRNLAGQCLRHYDTAGLAELQSCALTGAVTAQSRRLLAGEYAADWAGDTEQAWLDALEPEDYLTLRTFDATGTQLTLKDARGHLQRQAYDVGGQFCGSWLALQGQAEQPIVASVRYWASANKAREVHGNAIITDYSFDPLTQRLTGIRVQRPGTANASARTLQDLLYGYDPLGNVLSVANAAEATHFWRNQKVLAERRFVYDSLYQLVQATGREMAKRGAQGPLLPDVLVPLPTDDSAYTNYTRRYSYDSGGNLTRVQHSAPASNNNYTTQLTVSNRSNRAMLAREGLLPEHVDDQFDAGGHQSELLAGQGLEWSSRGELACVSPIQRASSADDREWYRYDSGGRRLLKASEQQAAGVTQVQRVLYLEGLELRHTWIGSIEKSNLEVIRVAAAGGAEVQLLHWVKDLAPGVENDCPRYSYHDLGGSSGLELDGRGQVISLEEYYPYGGTSVWTARSQHEANYKTVRYAAKERDQTGLYYYGARYYQPWIGRWLSVDPAGTLGGINLFCMVRNNPVTLHDIHGLDDRAGYIYASMLGGDVLKQIVGQNRPRLTKNKPLYPVIVADDQAKTNLTKMIASALSKVEGDLSDFQRRIGLLQGQPDLDKHAAELAALNLDFQFRLDFIDVLSDIKIESNEGGMFLSSLNAGSSKIYLIGHGGPGISGFAADSAGGLATSAVQVADQLVKGRLPTDFEDIRVASCFSADTRPPASFDPVATQEASMPARYSGPYLGSEWDKDGLRQPVAKTLAEQFNKMGFGKMVVSGYHGAELTFSEQPNHVNRLSEVGSATMRRSSVRQRFFARGKA